MENIINAAKQDFASDQMVKWCPGCGDHAILASLLKILPRLGKKKEDILVVSGIGCSSRAPYYVNTYGIHGIHGRGLAIASGAKVANPNLSVWVTTGDGDCLAIGGNHFIHCIRRNMDVKIILFNNQIYGLTKGQYSPTSPFGKVTVTSPMGTIEEPFNPAELAIGAGANFIGRSFDLTLNITNEVMLEAAKHKGAALVEMLQNCVIYNQGAHAYYTDKEHRNDRVIHLENGKPMIFGKNMDKGIILNTKTNHLEVVTIGENGVKPEDILVHKTNMEGKGLHLMLAQMKGPDFPLAVGVIRDVPKPSYDELLEAQISEAKESSRFKGADDLFNAGNTWEVE